MAKLFFFAYFFLPCILMMAAGCWNEHRIEKKKAKIKAEAIKEYKDSLFFMDLGEGEKYYQTY